jgi:hypothetical protein
LHALDNPIPQWRKNEPSPRGNPKNWFVVATDAVISLDGIRVPKIGSKAEARRPQLPRASVLRIPVRRYNERKLRVIHLTG